MRRLPHLLESNIHSITGDAAQGCSEGRGLGDSVDEHTTCKTGCQGYALKWSDESIRHTAVGEATSDTGGARAPRQAAPRAGQVHQGGPPEGDQSSQDFPGFGPLEVQSGANSVQRVDDLDGLPLRRRVTPARFAALEAGMDSVEALGEALVAMRRAAAHQDLPRYVSRALDVGIAALEKSMGRPRLRVLPRPYEAPEAESQSAPVMRVLP